MIAQKSPRRRKAGARVVPLLYAVAPAVFFIAWLALRTAGTFVGVTAGLSREAPQLVHAIASHKDGVTGVAATATVLLLVCPSLRAVRKAKAEERYYRTLVENVSEVIAVIGIDRKIHYVSPAIRTVLGYTETEVMAAGSLASIHQDDIPLALAEIERITRDPESPGVPQIVRHRHKDGRWLTMEGVMRVVRETTGSPRYVLTLRDVTRRKEMERALRQSEEHLRYLSNGTFEALHLVEHGRIISCNEQAQRMFRYSQEVLTGMKLLDLVHSDSFDIFASGEGRESASYELLARRSDGSTFPAEILRRPMLYYGRRISVIAVRNISDRKQIEAAVRAQEQRYRALVESMRDVIMIFSPDATITTLNSAFERTLGWRCDEWAGRSFLDLVHADDSVSARDAIAAALAQREVPPVELRLRARGTTWIVGEVGLAAQVEGEKVAGVIGVVRDITDRKSLEEQLLRSERLEGIGAIASGITHDLNNILQPILFSAGVLSAGTLDPEMKSMVSIVEESAARGREIVNQILKFARGTPGELKSVSLARVVREAQSMLRASLPRSIVFTADIAPDLHPLVGNATRLTQVLMNLCINARDSMPDGGRLAISARNCFVIAEDGAAPPGLETTSVVELRVADTGCGIPQALHQKIFEPFFTTKDPSRGTGLGLATVARIVREHHGSVKLESEVGRGTAFTLRFPAAPDTARAPEPELE